MFLVKEPGERGICSIAYLKQLLAVVFSYHNGSTPNNKKVYIYGRWRESSQRKRETTTTFFSAGSVSVFGREQLPL